MGTRISLSTRSVITFMVIAGWFSVCPSRMTAQGSQGSQGQKAVWNSTGLAGSSAWLDASAWWSGTSAPDLCSLLATNILKDKYNSNYPNGTVIDARGLVYAGTSTTCSVDPFSNLNGPPPSTTLLLPSGYIDIAVPWTVPNNTRIIGDEQGTRIRTNFSGPYMIAMGGSNTNGNLCPSSVCTSVGLEHLILDGNMHGGYLVGGINNQYAQAGSYVDVVNLYLLGGTGLSIGAGAINSGPYSNISYVASVNANADCGTGAGHSCPVCVDLEAQTQGLHGLTCNGNAATTMLQQHAGIYVNASNETIEDVHIESFWDGIEVGVSAVGTPGTATNVTLSNIAGSETGSSGYTTNTIHLCGNHPWDSSNSSTCASTSGMTVEDITILDAMNLNPPYTLNMTTKIAPTIIADDVTANAIASCRTNGNPPGCPTVLSTAIYALGEPDGGATTGASFSKFTSSPATPNGNYQSPPYTSYMPTWGVGSGAPNNGNTAYCSPVGAIYSQTTASGKSVYVCTPAGEWATIR